MNLADNRPKRRLVPLQRQSVWCVRCGKRGHYPAECTQDLRYIEQEYEEDIQWTEESDNVEWRLVSTSQPNTTPRPPMKPPGIGRGTGPMGTRPITRPPPGRYPDPNTPVKGQCWNCGDRRHFSPSDAGDKNPKNYDKYDKIHMKYHQRLTLVIKTCWYQQKISPASDFDEKNLLVLAKSYHQR